MLFPDLVVEAAPRKIDNSNGAKQTLNNYATFDKDAENAERGKVTYITLTYPLGSFPFALYPTAGFDPATRTSPVGSRMATEW